MFATKRKFHSLLESLTNNSSSTNLSHDTTKDGVAKRRRLEQPSGIRRKILEPKSRRRDRPTSFGVKDRPRPNYAPWDRQQFLDRLRTFKDVERWKDKPAAVDEVQWAKRGWSCVGQERVACAGGCGREVYIDLGQETRHEGDEEEDGDGAGEESEGGELVAKYVEMISTEHDEGCLWRKRGCDGNIYRIPLAHSETAISALKSRYTSLVQVSSDLPTNISLPDDVEKEALFVLEAAGSAYFVDTLDSAAPGGGPTSPDAEGSQSRTEPEKIQRAPSPISPSHELPSFNKIAASLALLGWRADSSGKFKLLTCDACFRRIGLWLFSPSISTHTDSDLESETLAPVTEHRSYCPWINANTQNGILNPDADKPVAPTTKLPGWHVLVRVIRSAYHLSRDQRPSTATTDASVISGDSVVDTVPVAQDRETLDRQRWTKLKQLKRVFDIQSLRGK